MLVFAAIVVVMAAAAADSVHAKDFYVSPFGNDNASGTSSAEAFKTIARAAQAAGSGDRVELFVGTYSGDANTKVTWDAGVTVEAMQTNQAPSYRVDFSFTSSNQWAVKYSRDFNTVTTFRGLQFANASSSAGLMSFASSSSYFYNVLFDKVDFLDNNQVLVHANSYARIKAKFDKCQFHGSSGSSPQISVTPYATTSSQGYLDVAVSHSVVKDVHTLYTMRQPGRITYTNANNVFTLSATTFKNVAVPIKTGGFPVTLNVNDLRLTGVQTGFDIGCASSQGTSVNMRNVTVDGAAEAGLYFNATTSAGSSHKCTAAVRESAFINSPVGVGATANTELNMIQMSLSGNSKHAVALNTDSATYSMSFGLIHSKVSGNKGADGAGLYIGASVVANVYNVTFDQNQATSTGGAIYLAPGSSTSITQCMFSRNTAGDFNARGASAVHCGSDDRNLLRPTANKAASNTLPITNCPNGIDVPGGGGGGGGAAATVTDNAANVFKHHSK